MHSNFETSRRNAYIYILTKYGYFLTYNKMFKLVLKKYKNCVLYEYLDNSNEFLFFLFAKGQFFITSPCKLYKTR